MIKAVILDFDGIVLESVNVKGDAFQALFRHYPEHQDAILAFHLANGGMPRFDKIRYFYKHIFREPLSEETFNALCDQYAELVVQKVIESPFVSGMEHFLEQYASQLDLFIVSGTPHDEINYIIQKRQLTHYFKAVMGSPTDKSSWTATILNDYQYDPKSLLWVGDALSDLKAANDHGVFFVGRTTQSPCIFDQKSVDLIIEDIHDLNKFLFNKIAV